MSWLPRPHWPSVRGRARADAGPLLLAVVVVVVVTLLAAATPPLVGATADDAVRDAVGDAGDTADVFVQARWDPDNAPGGGRTRSPSLADDVEAFRRRAGAALDPGLRAALRPPATIVSSPTLRITDGTALRTFQLTYLADDRGPFSDTRVTWTAGGPPPPGAPGVVTIPYNAPPWTVHIGLSDLDARALGVGVGDRIPLVDDQKRVKDAVVSGIFRPDDDPGWRLAPWLVGPVSGSDGVGTTRLGGLVSPDSLPDLRLAFESEELVRTVRFAPDPSTFTVESGRAVAGSIVALKVSSGSSAVRDASLKWDSRLDVLLREVQRRVDAASAQASVLLIAVVAGAVLVLLLAADLLVRRRTPALALARRRGAGLPDLGVELLLESVPLALVAAAVGLALAAAIAPGVSWWWALPVAVVAAFAGPGFGVFAAARATRDRRVPANRSARRFIRRTAALRRAALDIAVAIAAVVAVVTLHQRGVLPADAATNALGAGRAPSGGDSTLADGGASALGSGASALAGLSGPGGGAALPAAAPALGVIAGALVLLRLLPAALGLLLRQMLRSRGPLGVFGTARAAATADRALPLLAMVATAALATFALSLGATADRGLSDGAWQTVGADARLDLAPGAAVPPLPGVRLAVPAQVTDNARVLTGDTLVTPRLVIVDALALRRLLATTPLPDAPALSRLTSPSGGEVPALVLSASGDLRPGMRLELPRDGADPVPLRAVGTAPRVGDVPDVVIVDAAALGIPLNPNTVWIAGPEASVPDDAVLRETVLAERRSAPLTAGLLRLACAAAAVLLALGLLALTMGAASGAPDRWHTLSRLRTLGLRTRDIRWVALGELLPPVLVAAVGGPLLGLLMCRATFDPLSLNLLTGQPAAPSLAISWWSIALVGGALPAAVLLLVPAEAAVRRRRGLSEPLRTGG